MRPALLAIAVATLVLVPARVASAYVYWSDGAGSGSIGRAGPDGEPAPGDAWIPDLAPGCGVAVDGAHLYWTTRAGTIGRAGIDGSDVEPSFIQLPGGWACGVAVDAGHVYWASNSSGKLGRANLDGSGVQPSWMSPGEGKGCGIAVDATSVYWATETGVYAAPVAGGPARTISTATTGNCGIAVNAVHVYWASGDGQIERDGIAGGPPTPIASAPQAPCGVAVDSGHVYWASSAADTISRANLDGSGVERRFVVGARNPCGVAVDSAGAVAPGPGSSAPSNAFRLGQVSKDRRRGTARLEVLLPGPGTVNLTGPKVRERRVVLQSAEAGTEMTPVEIAIKPRRATRQLLRTFGIAITPISVVFTPLGGEPKTRYLRVWLAQRPRERPRSAAH